jgi:hypothetical protein
MNTQPVFLKVGLNYPHQRQRRDYRNSVIVGLVILVIALTVLESFTIVALRRAQQEAKAK